MPFGPGKYDDALTAACAMCEATSALLLILDGKRGAGMACHSTIEEMLMLPAMLRHVADDIEATLAKGQI